MAGESRTLKVVFSLASERSLGEIRDWNAEHYSVDHADRYWSFLVEEAERLSTEYYRGKVVPTEQRLSYIVIRRRRKGHGHVVVYRLRNDMIDVINIYHTAQDWQMKLGESEGR